MILRSYSSLNPRFKVKDIIAEPIKFFKNISKQDLNQIFSI